MFGIIWSFFVGIGGAISYVKLLNENKEKYKVSEEWDENNIKNNKIPKQIYYKRLLDGRTIEINKKTGEQVISHIINGDDVITDLNGNVIRNFSEEQRNLNFENGKINANKNQIAIKISNKKGGEYKDLKTNEIYHEVSCDIYKKTNDSKAYYLYFYQNKNGKLVCLSDNGICKYQKSNNKNKPSIDEVNNFIKTFNNFDSEDKWCYYR